jgi:hypothetical protein
MKRMHSGLVSLVVLSLAVALLAAFGPAPDSTKVRTCTELFPGHTSIQPGVKGTATIKCLWKGKKSLKVYFLDGDPQVQDRVKRVASEWTGYSGITFDFGNDPAAEVRITFTRPGSWSYVGACQWDVSPADATMNFGWLTPDTPEDEYRRVVLHEFGHALGLVHEHQNPAAKIAWNMEAVYEYYQRTQHWNHAETYANVIQKYSEGETNHTAYDPRSIMEYSIPKELTTDGFSVGWNAELSSLDKEFIREMYNSQ